MAWHLYVVPAIGDGTPKDARRPKYVADAGVNFSAMDYGFEPVFLLAADTDATLDATIDAAADAERVPNNLDGNPGAGAVTTVQNFLENLNVPAGWVNTGLTWRQIVRVIAGLFQFMQRCYGLSGNVSLFDGVTLNTQFNAMPLALRQTLQAAAASFNYDTSALSGTSTYRQILKAMADQWDNAPIVMGGITI